MDSHLEAVIQDRRRKAQAAEYCECGNVALVRVADRFFCGRDDCSVKANNYAEQPNVHGKSWAKEKHKL